MNSDIKGSLKSPYGANKMEKPGQTPKKEKPPLYVPGMRQSKELNRDRLSRGGTRQRGASNGPGGEYVSKTGFSSLCEPSPTAVVLAPI